MKKPLIFFLILSFSLPLFAEELDQVEWAIKELSAYFDAKTYVANHRKLVEADLGIPEEILIPLQIAEISYMRLLRHEILARNGCSLEDNKITKVFQGTKWYRSITGNNPNQFNEYEKYSIAFLENKENIVLLKAEKEFRGWPSKNKPPPPRDETPDKRGSLIILGVSPRQVKPRGEIIVTVQVANNGKKAWEPVGLSHSQEHGKYYISACWIDAKYPKYYFESDQYPLPRVVKPGETVAASGTLFAPKRPGIYFITFSILQGISGRFLDVNLSNVQQEFDHCPKMMVEVIQE